MSIAKSVVTGTVHRAPEKRFTQNNVAVSSFVLNIGEKEEMLIRVISRRQILDEIIDTIDNKQNLWYNTQKTKEDALWIVKI